MAEPRHCTCRTLLNKRHSGTCYPTLSVAVSNCRAASTLKPKVRLFPSGRRFDRRRRGGIKGSFRQALSCLRGVIGKLVAQRAQGGPRTLFRMVQSTRRLLSRTPSYAFLLRTAASSSATTPAPLACASKPKSLRVTMIPRRRGWHHPAQGR